MCRQESHDLSCSVFRPPLRAERKKDLGPSFAAPLTSYLAAGHSDVAKAEPVSISNTGIGRGACLRDGGADSADPLYRVCRSSKRSERAKGGATPPLDVGIRAVFQ